MNRFQNCEMNATNAMSGIGGLRIGYRQAY